MAMAQTTGFFDKLSNIASRSASVAESYAKPFVVAPAPPAQRAKTRLGELRLADDVRQALAGPLEDLGLKLEDFEPPIPGIHPRRKLVLERAGANGFVQIPKELLESLR